MQLQVLPGSVYAIDHLHARAKEFVNYDIISGGSFQAIEHIENIRKKCITFVRHTRVSIPCHIAATYEYSREF